MEISQNYIVVQKVEEPASTEEFKAVEVQDSFVYKGRVSHLPEVPVHMANRRIAKGDIILFAKYSPDTWEIEHEGEKMKFIAIRDILAVL